MVREAVACVQGVRHSGHVLELAFCIHCLRQLLKSSGVKMSKFRTTSLGGGDWDYMSAGETYLAQKKCSHGCRTMGYENQIRIYLSTRCVVATVDAKQLTR